MQDKVVYAGITHLSYTAASETLAKIGALAVGPKQVERLTKRIGQERCVERDDAVAAYQALPLTQRKEAPAGVTAPAVAVVGTDGGRLQILDRKAQTAAAATPPGPVADRTRAEGEPAGTATAVEAAAPPAPATTAPVEATPVPRVAVEAAVLEATRAVAAAVEATLAPAVGSEPRPAGSRRPARAAEAAVPPTATASATPPPAGTPRGRHWREDKVGLLMAMTSAVCANDPCPEIPEGFLEPTRMGKLVRELGKGVPVADEPAADSKDAAAEEEALHSGPASWKPPEVQAKRLLASRQSWEAFGPMVAQAAWAMGLFGATRRVFLGDGAENNWTLWRCFFSSFVPILDFIHALSYVYAAAHAGRDRLAGWKCYREWIGWVWQGQGVRVREALAARQAELGEPRPEDKETHPRNVVAQARTYLENNQERMKYDEYRRQGLPIMSSYVESAVKQFNQRVKGTEKFWGEEGAEAILQLRGDHLSDDQPLEAFWERRQAQTTGQRPYRRVG